MGIISQMAEKCQKCPKRDTCDHKRMEMCAYIDMPINCSPAMPQVEASISINAIPNTSSTTESILKEIESTISRSLKRNCIW